MFWFIVGLLVLLATLVVTFMVPRLIESSQGRHTNERVTKKKLNSTSLMIALAGLVLSAILIVASFVVVLQPGEVGIAYQLRGSSRELQVGYNFVAPWARMHRWDTTMQVVTFSQGDAADDIYGAQTTEKDYIEVVATIGVHIDTSKMTEYIALYGNEQISSKRITKLLKTISRNSIESIIGSYTTSEVMGNKKKIGEEASTHLKESIKDLPIILDSFTIDDLVAPESYELAIKEQAQLRMEKEKATLQQQINEQEALANKTKAEGDAAVLKTQAEADAAVKKIEAENAASVAKIKADNDAEVKKIQAEAEASVRKTQAEAQATEITTKANAEAEATIKKGEAEAKAIAAQGEAYNQNPQLIDLKKAEISAEVQSKWAENWSGYSFEGMSGFNFADLTEILKNLINPSIPAVVPAE